MEYTTLAQSANQGAASAYKDYPATPVFDGVPQVAERAEMACDRLQRFLDRFHGVGQAAGANVSPVPCGHIGQLQRLGATIDRLERIASEIDQIG